MSPTTRSARVGAGARAPVSSGTPMDREVSVAPLPDGSWVVKPRAGTVPPRRTRPRKDYSGLFTPLADALEHGPGNSCISHDPGFAALRDNLRVRHRAVYRGAVATASAAVDDEETLAPHHEPSAQPAEETPHVHSIPAHSCDDRDENSDPALLGTTNATDADTDAHCDAAGVHQDTEKTTGRVTVQTEFPDLYALPEDTQEDPRLAPAEVVGTGATAVFPSLESEDRQWKTPAPPRHHASLAIPPSTVRGGGDGFGFGTSLKTPRATVPLSLNDDQLFSPLESDARCTAWELRGTQLCGRVPKGVPRDITETPRAARTTGAAAEGLCARRARGGFAEGRGGGELFSKLGPADPRWTTRAVARYVRTGRRASARRRGQELHVPEPRDVQQDAGAARGGSTLTTLPGRVGVSAESPSRR